MNVKSHNDLEYLLYLFKHEKDLEEIQADINRARRKYFDVQDIQLKMDRRQADLDRMKKRCDEEKGRFICLN